MSERRQSLSTRQQAQPLPPPQAELWGWGVGKAVLSLPSAHLFCCTLWQLQAWEKQAECQDAAASRGWARKRNSAPHSSLWAYFCCCSSKGSRAWGKLVDHSPSRELGWYWPRSSSPAEEGVGELGLGQFYPLSPGQQFLALLNTQFHLSTVKIDEGHQPQVPHFFFFFPRENLHFSGCLWKT